MSKNKFKSSFQDEWHSNELNKTWVKKVDDRHEAYANVCMKSFSVSGLGVKVYTQKRKPVAKVSSFQKLRFQANEKVQDTDRNENKEYHFSLNKRLSSLN